MSTPQAIPSVKQALVEKIHQEIVPELEQLIEQLPEQLLDFQQAEVRLRQGLLQVAQHLLAKWADVADLSVQRPECPECKVPMRHKGRLPGSMVTTLGEVLYRRPRWRCEECGHECYPHDAVLCFLKHRVSWALAKVTSRMACQLGSFEEARDTLQDDYGIHLAKETIRDVSEAAGQRVLQRKTSCGNASRSGRRPCRKVRRRLPRPVFLLTERRCIAKATGMKSA